MGHMEGLRWIAENWFTILSAIGIVGGLVFTAVSLRSETKTRKIANLLTMTANHRELWKEVLYRPELARVIDASAHVTKRPITAEEQALVNMVILHTSSVYEALKNELVIKQEGLRRDVGLFFSLPIPRAVWEKTKVFQNKDFVAFVEKCRRGGADVLRIAARILGLVERHPGLDVPSRQFNVRGINVEPDELPNAALLGRDGRVPYTQKWIQHHGLRCASVNLDAVHGQLCWKRCRMRPLHLTALDRLVGNEPHISATPQVVAFGV